MKSSKSTLQNSAFPRYERFNDSGVEWLGDVPEHWEVKRIGHLPLVRERSIVIAITGQGKTRGTAALLMIPATINQHLAYIQIESGAAIPEFVHLNLTAQYFQLRAISDSGSTKGALTCQDVKEFKIALPPVSEQEALIATSQKIQKDFEVLAAKFNSQIQTLQTLRSTLIAHAVTGRIKV